jgi:hypothetical protein
MSALGDLIEDRDGIIEDDVADEEDDVVIVIVHAGAEEVEDADVEEEETNGTDGNAGGEARGTSGAVTFGGFLASGLADSGSRASSRPAPYSCCCPWKNEGKEGRPGSRFASIPVP